MAVSQRAMKEWAGKERGSIRWGNTSPVPKGHEEFTKEKTETILLHLDVPAEHYFDNLKKKKTESLKKHMETNTSTSSIE